MLFQHIERVRSFQLNLSVSVEADSFFSRITGRRVAIDNVWLCYNSYLTGGEEIEVIGGSSRLADTDADYDNQVSSQA